MPLIRGLTPRLSISKEVVVSYLEVTIWSIVMYVWSFVLVIIMTLMMMLGKLVVKTLWRKS